jgi:hypothetical protein
MRTGNYTSGKANEALAKALAFDKKTTLTQLAQ